MQSYFMRTKQADFSLEAHQKIRFSHCGLHGPKTLLMLDRYLTDQINQFSGDSRRCESFKTLILSMVWIHIVIILSIGTDMPLQTV